MLKISFISEKEIGRVNAAKINEFERLRILGDISRFNALSAVKRAGSGHLGSSLSSMELFTYLYFKRLNISDKGTKSPDRDLFFSSKGHDCPGQYSVLVSAGILGMDMLLRLRRFGGLDGHPDTKIRGMEANTGSLGMGISKAKGMALAKKLSASKGSVFVMTGDGELQEGQNWEALQTTAAQKITNVTIIVDSNKIQTDRAVAKVISLGDLKKKFEVFGWHVEKCDGHDFKAIDKAFSRLDKVRNKPKALIADTVKGKGVSFMEGPKALRAGNGIYKWHSGAPDDESFEAGSAEILNRINKSLKKLKIAPVAAEVIEERPRNRVRLKDTAEKVVTAYGEALVELGKKRKDMIVLDADLSADCGLRPFENAFPDRFVENGIAEQDMVSMAGGLALQGYLPIVNSFGVFLASRANEQIYNNATEQKKIVYVCHYAGLIPAGPGKSHQSLRDISLFGALPDFAVIEPCNPEEAKEAIRWSVLNAEDSSMIRLVISPCPGKITLSHDYKFAPGKGTVLNEGKDAVIFGYGPVLLNEALKAAELLKGKGVTLKVVNMPWLNMTDNSWLEGMAAGFKTIFALDNHSPYGGLADSLLNALNGSQLSGTKVKKMAVEGHPACGTPAEALKAHGLDAQSIAERILKELKSEGL